MDNPYVPQIVNFKLTSVQVSLQKAILNLLQNNPLQEIKVRSLCLKAKVSRSSFYTYYDNTDELLNDIENRLITQISDLDSYIVDSSRKEASDF